MPEQTELDPHLRQSLKVRHLTMISLGGVIGAGLFVGSSATISSTGPGAFLVYALTGIIVMLIMRMLGEMACAHPTTGSFIEYARMAYGNWAGFSTGWFYWYFWVIVVGFEAVVGGQIINGWLPILPVWAVAAALLVIMTMVNLLSVGAFGEAEYWFAGIKVAAIIVFVAVAGGYALGLWPNSVASFSNLTVHGGLFPHGIASILSGVVVVLFSMSGVEVAAIAAAESEHPERNLRKAVNAVMLRILTFYVLSIFLIVVVQPWTQITAGKSPFLTTLETIGIPRAGTILTVIILVAVLSALNAGLYTSSRLLFSLSSHGDAPAWMAKVNGRGVPIMGVLVSTLVGYGCVLISALFPKAVFLLLINSSGTVFLIVYLVICLSQLRLRKRWELEGKLKFKMWLHPVLPALVTCTIVAVLVSMIVEPSTRVSLLQSFGAWTIIVLVYACRRKVRQRSSRTPLSASATH
jgi:GABA permease